MTDPLEDELLDDDLRRSLRAHANKLLTDYPRVRRECNAEDLVQEALVRCVSTGKTVAEIENLGAYLRTTMSNFVMGRSKKFAREYRTEPSTPEPTTSGVKRLEPKAVYDLGRNWRREADLIHSGWAASSRVRVDFFAVLLLMLRQNALTGLTTTLLGKGTLNDAATFRSIIEALYPWGADQSLSFKPEWPTIDELWNSAWDDLLEDPGEFSPDDMVRSVNRCGGNSRSLKGSLWYKWNQRARQYFGDTLEELDMSDGDLSPLWKTIRLRSSRE